MPSQPSLQVHLITFESDFKIQALQKTAIAIFASGSGTNAEKIMQHFQAHDSISIKLLVCNRKDAGVWEKAKAYKIPGVYCPKSRFYESNDIVNILKEEGIDWIVLSGFLLKIGKNILDCYPNRIINIHPALLPKYGGPGMYGMHVHKAVAENGEKESGISIHLANENYDEGAMIAQYHCDLEPNDGPEEIQQKVQQLEHAHFAPSIEKYILAQGE